MEINGSSVKGFWNKYLGDEAPETKNQTAGNNSNAVVAPIQVKTDNLQIESTQEYKMLYEAVWARASALTGLVKTYDSLKDIITDDQKRFAAAVKALESTGGYSANNINQAILMHMGSLDIAKKKFEKEVKEQSEASVGNLEKELSGLSVVIEQKRAEMNRLSQEIAEAEARQNTLGTDISSSKEKYSSVVRTFASAVELIETSLKLYAARLKSVS